ncbi:chaperone protein DNAj, putative [Leishmania guyanensis]|uniref:Chaperone protein DNAj, putative n=1 Tax=Leishmania guyanensis TaxID=5670 RepID=A0A1E1ITG0_LEIGU|nr:chaperone protein DNAj, putative [Leishmania guyanensis]
MSAVACLWSHTEWTPYAVLRVSPSATMEDIRTAFRRMALLTHPDKAKVKATTTPSANSGETAPCTAPPVSFLVVKEASEVLLDPCLRAAYDAAHSHVLEREVGAVSDTYYLEDDFTCVMIDGGEDDGQCVHVYQRECRCGGMYEVRPIPVVPTGSGGDEDVPISSSTYTVRCQCDSCSLVVEVVV